VRAHLAADPVFAEALVRRLRSVTSSFRVKLNFARIHTRRKRMHYIPVQDV
jgi:hypothetical protein